MSNYDYPRIDRLSKLMYMSLMTARKVTNKPTLFHNFKKNRLDSRLKNIAKLQESNIEKELSSFIDIDADSISPKEFQKLLTTAKAPIVLRRFCPDIPARKKWTIEWFKEKYGDFEVPLGTLGEDGFPTGQRIIQAPFETLLSDILTQNSSRHYLSNCADIFSKHPELEEDLPMEKIASYLGRSHIFTQLFLGGKNTMSQLHCATAYNFFLMIHGEKEWTFHHPAHSPWMYPQIHQEALFCFTQVNFKYSNPSDFPLYEQIPKKKVILKPGDALLNLPWWWHAVDNLSDHTIGVASRWDCPYFIGNPNPFFSFLQLITPSFWKIFWTIQKQERIQDDDFRNKFSDGSEKLFGEKED